MSPPWQFLGREEGPQSVLGWVSQRALRLPSKMAFPEPAYQWAPESFWQTDGVHIRAADLESPPVSQTLQGPGALGLKGPGQDASQVAVAGPPQ